MLWCISLIRYLHFATFRYLVYSLRHATEPNFSQPWWNVIRNREISFEMLCLHCNVYTTKLSVSLQNFTACCHIQGKWMICDLGRITYYFCHGDARQAPCRFASAVEVINLFSLTGGPWWPWIAHPNYFPFKMNFTFFVPTCDPPSGASFDPWHHLNKTDKGPIGDATNQKSKLYPFQFQRRRILRLVFFVPMFPFLTPWFGSVLTPGV